MNIYQYIDWEKLIKNESEDDIISLMPHIVEHDQGNTLVAAPAHNNRYHAVGNTISTRLIETLITECMRVNKMVHMDLFSCINLTFDQIKRLVTKDVYYIDKYIEALVMDKAHGRNLLPFKLDEYMELYDIHNKVTHSTTKVFMLVNNDSADMLRVYNRMPDVFALAMQKHYPSTRLLRYIDIIPQDAAIKIANSCKKINDPMSLRDYTVLKFVIKYCGHHDNKTKIMIGAACKVSSANPLDTERAEIVSVLRDHPSVNWKIVSALECTGVFVERYWDKLDHEILVEHCRTKSSPKLNEYRKISNAFRAF